MQLKEFLDHCSTRNDTLKKYPVICFSLAHDGTFPVIFFQRFITFLKSNDWHVESIDLLDCIPTHAISQLETSFLGMGLTYWLRGFAEVDKKYRHHLLEYLSTYQGPHQVIVIIEKDVPTSFDSKTIIEIPLSCNPALFASLLTFLKKKNTSQMQKCIQALCTSYEKISLDQACMAIEYMQVIGKYEDCMQFFERILELEKSLFSLSQHFFAKDATAFFTLWARFESEYPPTFWSIFWSEQLWRAYHASYFLKNKQFQHAKNIGFRLPFSYMQRDWKKSTLHELKNAHQFIYALDLASKNSIETQAGIDLFYSKFFLNEF